MPGQVGAEGEGSGGGGGGVSGSGTTNTVAKFTGASAIGNSNLFCEVGGQCGLNTITPTANFHIAKIQAGSTGGEVSWLVGPIDTASGLAAGFGVRSEASANDGSSRPNQVYTWGYNIEEKDGEPVWAYSLESYYAPVSDELAQMEHYMTAPDGTRVWSMFYRPNEDSIQLSWQMDLIGYYDKDFTRNWATFSSANGIAFSAGVGNDEVRLHTSNNAEWVVTGNSGGIVSGNGFSGPETGAGAIALGEGATETNFFPAANAVSTDMYLTLGGESGNHVGLRYTGASTRLWEFSNDGTVWLPFSDLSGAGEAGRVALWGATSVLSSDVDLFWDAGLGIDTATPNYLLDLGNSFPAKKLAVYADLDGTSFCGFGIGAGTLKVWADDTQMMEISNSLVSVTGNLNVSGAMQFAAKSRIDGGTTDGIVTLTNNASNGFTRLNFGAATSGFAALKPVTALFGVPGLAMTLGDDSAQGTLQARDVQFFDGTDTVGYFSTGGSNFLLRDTFRIKWSSTTDATGTADTGITRNAAGVIEINSGTTGTFRDLRVRKHYVDQTITAGGTTGNQTIDKAAGTVNIAIGQSSITVTNNLCTTSSTVFVVVRTNDAAAVVKNVVPALGSFTITLNAATGAETSIGFLVVN